MNTNTKLSIDDQLTALYLKLEALETEIMQLQNKLFTTILKAELEFYNIKNKNKI
jgi:hypothetical protein